MRVFLQRLGSVDVEQQAVVAIPAFHKRLLRHLGHKQLQPQGVKQLIKCPVVVRKYQEQRPMVAPTSGQLLRHKGGNITLNLALFRRFATPELQRQARPEQQ